MVFLVVFEVFTGPTKTEQLSWIGSAWQSDFLVLGLNGLWCADTAIHLQNWAVVIWALTIILRSIVSLFNYRYKADLNGDKDFGAEHSPHDDQPTFWQSGHLYSSWKIRGHLCIASLNTSTNFLLHRKHLESPITLGIEAILRLDSSDTFT